MNHVTGTLTVFFEGPFWVGVFERAADGEYAVARVIFRCGAAGRRGVCAGVAAVSSTAFQSGADVGSAGGAREKS